MNSSLSKVLTLAAATALVSALPASAAIQTTTAFDGEGVMGFRLKGAPAPAKNDAATKAKFSIVDGEADSNGGGLEVLHDGKTPMADDEPERNFFFAAGTKGGRILVDLDHVAEVKAINTYSWHSNTRGPQVYKLYASDGTASEFKAKAGRDVNPTTAGWKLISEVDTTAKGGGQHIVSITDPDGLVGKYRYLLLDVSPTENDDPFGNTFFSEIDVLEANAPTESTTVAATEAPVTIKSADGYCNISIDTSAASDLREWSETKLAPVLAEWYPKLVAMLPSEGFEAATNVTITIKPVDGVAFASGNRITANSDWVRRELNREAVGALVHEMVHVVQSWGWARRANPGASRSPGWLQEGIPDYIRFFLYEPQTHGADLIWMQRQRNPKLSYDGMYRISANFLNYVVEKHDPEKKLIAKVNAACRQGKYNDDIWKELTGKELAALNDEWKASVQAGIAAKVESGLNVLTSAEQAAGWRLLFNGEDFAGWHNFKKEGVRPGWQVKDGALVCVDPHDAGDIVTTDKFAAFELELDYNISEGGNSGIIFHVTDEGGAVWATGPEFQLEDNAKAKDPQRCGWLYALYQPENDPKTGKPLDATKPAGEWNHVRLVISPEKCEHIINGVKYFEYVMGSEDFNKRVAASKFGKMPLFAKSGNGYLALQGDHGQVSFRNIKIRPLPSKPKS